MNPGRPDYLLALTASIQPAAQAEVYRRDPTLRLNDYLTALRFWLACPDPRLNRILFLENSGADLSPLRELVRQAQTEKEVEILSVPGNNIPPGINYGYGEMEMLDHGLRLSELRKTTTHMLKVTGRLMFPGISALLNKLPVTFQVAVDCRNRGRVLKSLEQIFKGPGAGKLNPLRAAGILRDNFAHSAKPFTSCQLMIFSHAFYDQHLRKAYHEMKVPYPTLIEDLIVDRLLPFKGQPGVLLRWPINVEPYGMAGHAAKKYDSPHRILIRQTRGILRRVAPDIWF